MSQDLFDKAAALLKKARKGVALTGAGVSTESGIPDFRGKDGLWSRYDPHEYGTMGAFQAEPAKVWRMLACLLLVVDAVPNEGHRGLALLEQRGMLEGIITQNIDGLHQKGGSKNVVEFHGSLATFSCLSCGEKYVLDYVKKNSSADLLLVAGTSCQVQPAARIPFMIFGRGAKIIEINREPVLASIAEVTLQGSFTDVMGELVKRLAD